jgi:hypothetical protein
MAASIDADGGSRFDQYQWMSKPAMLWSLRWWTAKMQERSMNAGWRIFLLFAVVFIAALGAERMFVPDIVPVAFTEEPRSLWSLQVAFVLRAVELIAAGVATIAFAIMFGAWVKSWPRRRAL